MCLVYYKAIPRYITATRIAPITVNILPMMYSALPAAAPNGTTAPITSMIIPITKSAIAPSKVTMYFLQDISCMNS